MTTDLRLLVYSALLAWVMLLTGSFLRSRLWTPAGLITGMGNRDAMPEPSPIAARADRAAMNMLENLVLFAALLLTAHAAGVNAETLELPARIFFYARVVYFVVYLAGIPFIRTGVWAVSVVGLAMIATELIA